MWFVLSCKAEKDPKADDEAMDYGSHSSLPSDAGMVPDILFCDTRSSCSTERLPSVSGTCPPKTNLTWLEITSLSMEMLVLMRLMRVGRALVEGLFLSGFCFR